jgi:hypothetical protein
MGSNPTFFVRKGKAEEIEDEKEANSSKRGLKHFSGQLCVMILYDQ